MSIINIILDILKTTMMLFFEMAPYIFLGLIFVGILNYFFSKDLIIKYVGKDNFPSVLKASLFGIPLPLCSCGVIPSAVYLSKNGASKSAVISFLISTPQTGIDSMIATYGMMGPVFAVFRPIAALFMGIIGGTAIRFLKEDKPKQQTPDIKIDNSIDNKNDTKNPQTRIMNSVKYSFVEFLDDISVQFIVGLFIAGLITFLVPDGFFENSAINNGIVGMSIMIAVGIPMYVCATASIPIAVSLMLKGFSPGVAFVFLATGPATNIASLTILINVLGKKVTFTFLGVIIISSILFGYLLDLIFEYAKINPVTGLVHLHHHEPNNLNELQLIIGLVFFILLLFSLYRKFLKGKFTGGTKKVETDNRIKINIEGMNCNHCVMNVKNAIAGTAGVIETEVILSENAAYINGNFKMEDVARAVESIGYKVVS